VCAFVGSIIHMLLTHSARVLALNVGCSGEQLSQLSLHVVSALIISTFCYHITLNIIQLHCVPKKGATKLMAVTSSNLNGFSKFFHRWKEKEISNKSTKYFPPHLKYVAALPLGIHKFKFVIKLPNKIKARIIFEKRKFHSYG